MIPYLLHVSLLLAGFYLVYHLVLRRETFFALNRWVLLGGLVLAFALPRWEIPQAWSLRKAQALETTPTPPPVIQPLPIEKSFGTSNIEPLQSTAEPADTSVSAATPKPDLATVLSYLYFGGLALLLCRFLLQVAFLLTLLLRNPGRTRGPFRIVELKEERAPFSFGNCIFINPDRYDPATTRQIIRHEQIHIAGGHGLDILLAELTAIVQWFNPFAWLCRRAVRHNLEYLTDHRMLNQGTNKIHYQLSLLQVAVPHLPLNLTVPYNQSILKQRIAMMNAKKSPARSTWKYLLLLPLLGLSVLLLNKVKTAAAPAATLPDLAIGTTFMSSSGAEIPPVPQPDFREAAPQPAAVSPDYAPQLSGAWDGRLDGDRLCLHFKGEDDDWQWGRSDCLPRSAFSNLPTGVEGEFTLKREAGVITFTGAFTGEEGSGQYAFRENASFRTYLEKEGFPDIKEELLFHFCLTGIDQSYIAYLRQQGYRELTGDQLAALAVHGTSRETLQTYVTGFKDLGFDQLTLEEITAMEIHEVDLDYVRELGDLVYRDLTIQEVIQAKIHDVEPDYIRALQAEGYPDLEFEGIVGFAIHDVDVNYIKALKEAGLKDLSAQEIIQAAIHDVDAAYIKELRGAGFEDLDFEDIVRFAIHDVDADFLSEFKAAGYSDLRFQEIIQFAIHDVDVDYIRSLEKMGFKDIPSQQLVQARIHDVDDDFIEEARKKGHTDLTLEEYIRLKIHGWERGMREE